MGRQGNGKNWRQNLRATPVRRRRPLAAAGIPGAQSGMVTRAGAVLLAGALLVAPFWAADAKPSTQDVAPAEDYAMAEQALQAGRVDAGLAALERTAARNGLRAQLRLGRIYREGKLVQQDEPRACQYFRAASEGHAQLDPKHPAAGLVGEAFRNWALCYAKGATEPDGSLDTTRAAELYYQAGVIFGDAQGLYELAMMYLTGEGIARNPALAVFHLYSAAHKRYPPALAQLGVLLWDGKVIKRKAGAGLALLILAREGAAPEDRAWITSHYDDAIITASRDEETEATRVASELRKSYGTEQTNALPVAVDEGVPLPQRSPLRVAPPGVARPLVPGPDETRTNSYRTQPTGADVPPDSAPPQP